MQKQTFLSPAKLNLFFSVLSKRADGFHEIASLYQAINLFDTLHFSISKKDVFTTDHPTLSMDENNLIVKAVDVFREKTDFSRPISIHLEKKIPMQSGLGGGSSNAATTLWALNQLANHPLSTEQLIELGALFGSDISFFFSRGTAYCTGRGEKVEDLTLPFSFSGYLFTNDFGLSTPRVYGAVQNKDFGKTKPEDLLEDFFNNKPRYINDLENPAFLIEPQLEQLKQTLLSKGFDQVSMTGSGTAFFCVCKPSTSLSIPHKSIQNVQRNSDSWYGV